MRPTAEQLGLGPLFSRIRDAVIVTDARSGRIVLWNPAAEALFGRSAQEARGQVLEDLLPGGPGEVVARQKNGEEIALEVDASDLDADHRLVIARDVTARRTLERERGSFLAAVSHDLKSPLAAISGQAQLLQRRVEQLNLPDGAQMIRRLARIDETTYRMSRLLEDLLDVARLQMGRPLELDRQPTDLVVLAQNAVKQLQPTASRHQLQVIAEAAQVVGNWDKLRIGRVVDNLLLSAIKYSPEGGQIVVTVRSDGAWGALEVSGPGLGVPEEDRSGVFERFHWGTNAARRTRGSGIGLAGSKQIVEQHGGTIAVESRAGGGSTFTVRLPLTE